MYIPDRFISKIDQSGDCWQWMAAKAADGYGRFVYEKKCQQAHRLAYQFWVGPIPDDLVLDHLCRNRSCVNPAHLEPVTQKVNNNRGMRSQPQFLTHCLRGHEYTPETTYARPGKSKECKVCRRAKDKARRSLKV
jgi:hypothetical protein